VGELSGLSGQVGPEVKRAVGLVYRAFAAQRHFLGSLLSEKKFGQFFLNYIE